MGRGHFLFCLPARLGVLLFSLLEFLVTGFVCAILIIILLHNGDDSVNLSKPVFGAVIGVTIVSGIIALVSFAGFIGALAKRLGGIRAFVRIIAWLIGVQLIVSILMIVAIWLEPKSEFIKDCENGRTDSDIVNTCTNKMDEVKGITTGAVVLALLLHFYELHVVSAYATQLEEKEYNRNIILGSKYTAVNGDDTRPLNGLDTSYAYADAAHSYGHQRGPSGSYA